MRPVDIFQSEHCECKAMHKRCQKMLFTSTGGWHNKCPNCQEVYCKDNGLQKTVFSDVGEVVQEIPQFLRAYMDRYITEQKLTVRQRASVYRGEKTAVGVYGQLRRKVLSGEMNQLNLTPDYDGSSEDEL